jgi:putative nucleotidyltransferase with HDIG domain
VTYHQNIVSFAEGEVVEIPKGFMFDGLNCPVEVFVRLKPLTYLLIARPGQKLDLTDYKSFSRKDFKLFVRASDKIIFSGLVDATTKAVVGHSHVPVALKSKLIHSLFEETLKDFERANFLDVNRIQATGKYVISLFESSKALKGLLESLDQIPGSQSKHSMATALISLIIAEESQMLTSLSGEKLVMGALLHDIGLKHVSPEIMLKPRLEWTLQELTAYKSHPRLGAEIVRHLPSVPMEVILIVAQHHENAKGTGYPEGIRDVKISPLSKIVGIANQITELLFDEDENRLSMDSVISYVEEVLGQPFNKGLWLVFKNIVNREYLSAKGK